MVGKHSLPDVCCAAAAASSCEIMDEGVVQRDAVRLAGLELKHKVISVRPLAGTLGCSRSNSSAASLSTALYLQRQNAALRHLQAAVWVHPDLPLHTSLFKLQVLGAPIFSSLLITAF